MSSPATVVRESRFMASLNLKSPAAGEPVAGPSSPPCQYIRGQADVALGSRLGDLKRLGGGLAGAAVRHDFEAKLLTLFQAGQASAFNRADMNEDVVAVVVGLDETETLLAVEPFYSAHGHGNFLPNMRAFEPRRWRDG